MQFLEWNCRFRTLKYIHIAVFKQSLHCRALYDSMIWCSLWKVLFIIAYINLVAEESEISKYRQNGSALQEDICPLDLFWRCRVCTQKMTSGNGTKMQCLWDKGHPSSATSDLMFFTTWMAHSAEQGSHLSSAGRTSFAFNCICYDKPLSPYCEI